MSKPVVLETIDAVRAVTADLRRNGATAALTPTLGALHDGHIEHVRRAASLVDARFVSIFVNPTQFGPNEDLAKYPRTLDADLERLAAEGVDYVFHPAVDELYPEGPTGVTVSAGPVGETFEGASRPGHFDGVLTVVAKLLNIVAPDVVTFGQKDAQQLFLVQRMIADLNLPARVEVIQTVREPDGLALSSRNRYLGAEHREAALVLSRALAAAAASAGGGADAALQAAHTVLVAEPLAELDYFELVDPDTFAPVTASHRGEAIAIVAAKVGGTRLIDNRDLRVG